jgi:hypothetical protein
MLVIPSVLQFTVTKFHVYMLLHSESRMDFQRLRRFLMMETSIVSEKLEVRLILTWLTAEEDLDMKPWDHM